MDTATRTAKFGTKVQTYETALEKARAASKRQKEDMYIYRNEHGGYNYSRYKMAEVVAEVHRASSGHRKVVKRKAKMKVSARRGRVVKKVSGKCAFCLPISRQYPMKHCPRCGRELSYNVILEAPRDFCHKCGHELKGAKHCSSCGEKTGKQVLEDVDFADLEQYVIGVVKPEEPNPVGIKIAAVVGWMLWFLAALYIFADKMGHLQEWAKF